LRQAYDYWQDQPGNYGAKSYTECELLHTSTQPPHNVPKHKAFFMQPIVRKGSKYYCANLRAD